MFSRIFLLAVTSMLLFSSAGYAAECNGGGRYDDNSDGTVTDCRTGLVWLKNASCNDTSGGVVNNAGVLYWDEAMRWVAGLGHGICGLSDGSASGAWRLPTKTEWMAMVENARKLGFSNPPLTNGAGTGHWTEGDVFNLINFFAYDFYWSGTTNSASHDQAWGIYVGSEIALPGHNGAMSSIVKLNLLPVWPVRAGQVGSFGRIRIQ